ncbi:hypothetical protein MJH12_01720, partial [bacterium]|nr:hypothetical protein [bacterium]
LLVAIACLLKSQLKILKLISFVLLIMFSFCLYHSQNIQNRLQFYYQSNFISHLVPNSKVQITNVVQTKYQVITEGFGEVFDQDGKSYFKDHFIFLDKALQLGTTWFKPYHQAFAAGGLLVQDKKKLNVLILGGGDLLLAQDLLGSGRIEGIDLVDIDQVFIDYLKSHPYYSQYNQYAHSSHLVKVHVKDAFLWVREKAFQSDENYDLIFVDFASLQDSDKGLHLYSEEFFSWCHGLLEKEGAMLTWVYDSKDHKSLMANIFHRAGFNYKKEYMAYTMKHLKDKTYSKDDDQSFVQTFWILTKEKLLSKTNISGFSKYQHLLYPSIIQEKWTKLQRSKLKSNSIFIPNYDLLVSHRQKGT